MMFSLFMIIWQVGRSRISRLLYWKLLLPKVREFLSLCRPSWVWSGGWVHLHDLEDLGQLVPVDRVQVFQINPGAAHAGANQVVLGDKYI
jgi:hypothetical protein